MEIYFYFFCKVKLIVEMYLKGEIVRLNYFLILINEKMLIILDIM